MKMVSLVRHTQKVLPAIAFVLSLFATAALPILMSPPAALAGTDTYPTSINGCRAVSGSPSGYFTCDLKDSTQDIYFDPWAEENRECTSYVAWMLHSVNGFDMPFNNYAIDWGTEAAAAPYNYSVNSTPAVGSVYWSNVAPYGHVAWVEAVNGSNVTIEDYNHDYTGHWDEYSVAASSATGYIHFKDLSSGGGTTPLSALAS